MKQQEECFCPWFTSSIQDQLEASVEILNDKIAREHDTLKEYRVEDRGRTQLVTIRYVGIVNVNDIEINPFSNDRIERARQWVTEKTMGRMFFSIKPDGTANMLWLTIANLSREYDHDVEPGKFKVTDGQHRIAVAIEQGVEKMMASVVETIKFHEPTTGA